MIYSQSRPFDYWAWFTLLLVSGGLSTHFRCTSHASRSTLASYVEVLIKISVGKRSERVGKAEA